MKNHTLFKTIVVSFLLLLTASNLLQAQIIVNSDFEGGNGTATFINEENNEVHITSELKLGDTKNIVYYVEISGLDINKPLILEVDATWRGHNIVYSYDQENWERSNITNYDNFEIALSSSTVYVAYTYPYVYSNMIDDVNAISDLDHVEVSNLTISEGGLPVKLVKITDDCIPDDEKELIWVLGRMHAFEGPGNLAVVGMMNYFASDEESAKRLRKEAIIYVVPMMDVDMAFNGGSGKDQTPVDFNRDWISLEHFSHWNAVKEAKSWIDSTSQLNNLSVFFDSHSPPLSHYSTLFYYVFDNLPQLKVNIDFVNDNLEQISGYRGDDAIYEYLDISTSQDYVLSIYDNPRLYNVTMETGFKTRPDGVDWTRELYILNGEYHGRAISEFIHGHSYEDDIIVDNNDPNVMVEGNWSSNTDIYGFLGEDYLYTTDANLTSVVFNATIDTAGIYEVFTRWVSHPSFTSNGKASFLHSGGVSNFTLDMTSKGGNWVSLGVFELEAGEEVGLSISNSETGHAIIADGLRISKLRACPTTSVTEYEKSSFDFTLFPNPAANEFTIYLESEATVQTVEIYDLSGKLVLRSAKTTISISTLPSNIYLVVVNTDQGKRAKKLIVK